LFVSIKIFDCIDSTIKTKDFANLLSHPPRVAFLIDNGSGAFPKSRSVNSAYVNIYNKYSMLKTYLYIIVFFIYHFRNL
jgi:hypothetical protein